MALAFVVDTQNFTVMVSDLDDMPTWSVLEAPAARKVQSILQNREYRNKAGFCSTCCLCCLIVAANQCCGFALSFEMATPTHLGVGSGKDGD